MNATEPTPSGATPLKGVSMERALQWAVLSATVGHATTPARGMLSLLMGIPTGRHTTPATAAEFAACCEMLDMVDVRYRLPRLLHHAQWGPLVHRWAELEAVPRRELAHILKPEIVPPTEAL